MDINLNGIDPDNLEGYDNPAAGSYHFLVQACDEGTENQSMMIDAEVLSGTTPNQEGKTHREYFTKPTSDSKPGVAKRLIILACALKLTDVAELQAAIASGASASIDWSQAAGKDFCGILTEETHKGKKHMKLGFDIFATDGQGAKDIPKNEAAVGTSEGPKGSNSKDDPFAGF